MCSCCSPTCDNVDLVGLVVEDEVRVGVVRLGQNGRTASIVVEIVHDIGRSLLAAQVVDLDAGLVNRRQLGLLGRRGRICERRTVLTARQTQAPNAQNGKGHQQAAHHFSYLSFCLGLSR